MKDISQELLKKCREGYKMDRAAHTMNAAMAKTPLADLAYIPMNGAKLDGEFEVEVKTRGITAQLQSGRCWIFAALNIMREIVTEKCGMKEFELSQNYLAFYDKLEKANNMLEMAIQYADRPIGDRMVDYIADGIWDGGYWDMAVDLVKKYGVVPKSVMPESYQSCHTDKFMRLLNSILRKDVAELREMVQKGIDPTARKEEMLAEIYKAECIVFGEPVESFDFTYRTEDGEYHTEFDMTPKAFYEKYVGMDLDNYISVTNEPTTRRELNKTYTFHYIGSMASRDVLILNLPMEDLKELTVKQLKDNEPIWFACDSGAYGDRKMGIWDQDSFDYEGLLGGIDMSMTKKDRLELHESFGTHAMLLVGVNFDKDRKPNRYKIENSWGEENGKKGYFVCSDKYFDEFVYEVVINKKHLSEKQKAIMNGEAIRIQPWER